MANEPSAHSKAGQVLAALRALGRATATQVAERAGTTPAKAGAHLCLLLRDGLVDRSGTRGNFTWWAEASG